MKIEQLAEYIEFKGCKLKGCSKNEISKVENYFNVKLPLVYIRFLLLMGKSSGQYMKGSSVFYDEIYSLRENAIELLEENSFRMLPEKSFVFYMHQGYQFAFFNLDDGDNPSVYYYYEGVNQVDFEKKEISLTDFFEKQLHISGLR